LLFFFLKKKRQKKKRNFAPHSEHTNGKVKSDEVSCFGEAEFAVGEPAFGSGETTRLSSMCCVMMRGCVMTRGWLGAFFEDVTDALPNNEKSEGVVATEPESGRTESSGTGASIICCRARGALGESGRENCEKEKVKVPLLMRTFTAWTLGRRSLGHVAGCTGLEKKI
jgi:hypothetical protein